MAVTKTEAHQVSLLGVMLVSWTLNQGESGTPVVLPDFPYISVVIRGVFGTSGVATLALQGANVIGTPAAAQWQTLNDRQGNAQSGIVAARFRRLQDTPYQLRPTVTGGDPTTAIIVELCCYSPLGLAARNWVF